MINNSNNNYHNNNNSYYYYIIIKIIIVIIDPAFGKKHSWLETYSTCRRDAFPLGNVCVVFSAKLLYLHIM